MSIGEFIQKRRKALGISQTKMARLSGLQHQTIVSRLEHDERPLIFGEAVILSAVLDFDIADLAALIPLPDLPCPVCADMPPEGFICKRCGASS
jgi:transcriptional regulator with XRE-family HTH domain